jgi:hypothetical protein
MTSALEAGECSVSRPRCTLPPGKTRYSFHRRLGGPQGQSGQVRKISPPPGFDTQTVQPVVSHYTDWATRPTEVFVGAENKELLPLYYLGSSNGFITWNGPHDHLKSDVISSPTLTHTHTPLWQYIHTMTPVHLKYSNWLDYFRVHCLWVAGYQRKKRHMLSYKRHGYITGDHRPSL